MTPGYDFLKRMGISCCVALALCLGMWIGVSWAEVPAEVTYQGYLVDSLSIAVSGDFPMEFRLYSTEVGGIPLWTETQDTVHVQGGVFSVLLGSANPLPSVLFDGSKLWLGTTIGIGGSELSPRRALVSVAYTFRAEEADHASMADTAAVALSTTGGDSCLWLTDGNNVWRSDGNVGIGMTHPEVGLELSDSTNSVGPYITLRQHGERADRRTGIGFRTYDAETELGSPYHAWTLQASNDYVGLGKGFFLAEYNDATGDGQPCNGSPGDICFANRLYVQAMSGNVGIGTASPSVKLAIATDENRPDLISASNANAGADAGAGMFFSADSGYNGGLFQASSSHNSLPGLPNNGAGMLVLNAGGTTNGIGIRTGGGSIPITFVNSTETMRLVNGNVGIGTTSPGSPLDVRGTSEFTDVGASPDTKFYATVGVTRAADATNNNYIGLTKQGVIPWGIGISATDNFIIGTAAAPARTIPTPLLCIAPHSGNVGIGTTNPTSKLHVAGDLCVTGAKNAMVSTSQGMTKVYSEESAEVWFTDYGRASLSNGKCHIELDPLFLETVTITGDHPMMVFLQEEGECNGLIARPGLTSFDVVEKGNGRSDAYFSYRVVAKRKGHENSRLEVAHDGGAR